MDKFRLDDRTKKILLPLGLVAVVVVWLIFRAGQPAKLPEETGDLAERVKQFTEEPTITVYINETGEKKEMKLEEYLVGVVAGEVGPEFHYEAIRAQAIIARTFTLERITRPDPPCAEYGADACTDPKEFQAYNPDNINDEIRKAVESTRGEVILYNGDFIEALYHSNAGGKTASKEESFPHIKEDLPYLVPVDSPDFEHAPEHKSEWSVTFSKEELGKAADVDPKAIDSVRITEKGPSGRAVTIAVGPREIHGADLRKELEPEKFRSTLITDITVDADEVTFSGKGWGHGAGLSQWGAVALAEDGQKGEDIISHYFKNVTVKKLW